MPRKLDNIIGKRFGRLVVLENLNIKKHNLILHKCQCDCGKIVNVFNGYLKTGHTTSCGCLAREVHSKHHLSSSRLYNIYCGMKRRCYVPNDDFYNHYGGRGIKICEDWLNKETGFKTFYDWAMANGYKDKMTIERIDVNGNYCPENCCWIPKGDQAKNTTRSVYITYNGETKSLSDWGRETNIPINTLCRRLKQYGNLEYVFYKGNLHRKIKRAFV